MMTSATTSLNSDRRKFHEETFHSALWWRLKLSSVKATAGRTKQGGQRQILGKRLPVLQGGHLIASGMQSAPRGIPDTQALMELGVGGGSY